jgi:UDP-N-acetylmuramyl pentapeptide phosphotransferase/UDP-N-acetylglucosamine-1-phosphate transferase
MEHTGHHFIWGEYMKLVTSVHFAHVLYQAPPTESKGPPPQVNTLWLLGIFALCVLTSFLLCYIAKALFPKFRSGEHKPGTHRPDHHPIGGREIKTIELPLVGGPAFMLAIVAIGLAAGFLLNFDHDQWAFLLIGLGASIGYATVGFLDDWKKVYSNEGLSEFKKFTGVFLVGCIAAALYFFLLPKLGQESYAFYKDLPLLNTLLSGATNPMSPDVSDVSNAAAYPVAHYSWLIFLMLLTGAVGSLTSLSVDFSDGLDGLAGGLVFSASLAMAIIIAFLVGKLPTGVVLEVLSLLGAGAILGYLPLNWPSAWAARRGKAKRRAKIIMGDCGALGTGGLLAIIAIFSRNELLLIMIGGAFVLEGLSVLISARIMTRFFRRHLQILRFASTDKFVPHTEFPLPFLATPLHHHFDLLGWDRRRLVYGAWALGAGFAALGVMAGLAPFTWQRYVARFLIFILAAFIWSSCSWSKCYFVGKHPAERPRRRRLALYYGYPYRIMGIRLYHLVEVIEASENVIETPAEELALWQRMTIYDARSMLGLYCYRAGYFPAAMAQWSRIFERNRLLRPEIAHLLKEVDSRLALEQHETQPIRRDQVLQQEPILAGNLPPADLPNPHEPVSHELLNDWEPSTPLEVSKAPQNDEGRSQGDQEEHQITAPLRGDLPGPHSF